MDKHMTTIVFSSSSSIKYVVKYESYNMHP